jgi:acyl-CoA thioesterase
MINGLATAHGGILFTFADTTLAFACNSRNVPHVALQCSISFVNAARLGVVYRVSGTVIPEGD